MELQAGTKWTEVAVSGDVGNHVASAHTVGIPFKQE